MIFLFIQKEPLKFDVNHCGAPEDIVHLVDNIKKVQFILYYEINLFYLTLIKIQF